MLQQISFWKCRIIRCLIYLLLYMISIFFLSTLSNTKQVDAAVEKAYCNLDAKTPKRTVGRCQIGNYYFYKTSSNNEIYYYSKSYSGNGKKICSGNVSLITNGQYIFYLLENKDSNLKSAYGTLSKTVSIYRKKLSDNDDATLVDTLKLTKDALQIEMLTCYSNQIYLSITNQSNKSGLYVYDLEKQKLSAKKMDIANLLVTYKGKNYYFLEAYDKYLYFELVDMNNANSWAAVYDCQKGKIIRKIKAKSGYYLNHVHVVKGKAYLTFWTTGGTDLDYTYVGFACTLTGKNLKRLWTYTTGYMKQPEAATLPSAAYYRSAASDGKCYQYNYKTKKTKQIKQAEYIKKVYSYLPGSSKGSTSVDVSGKIFTVGTGKEKRVYRITSDTEKKRTVALNQIAKTAKELVIPETVTNSDNGKQYMVTEIDVGAALSQTNLKEVVISQNVQTIGAKAFAGCNKLSMVTIYGYHMKNIGTNAFKTNKSGMLFRVEVKNQEQYDTLKSMLMDSGIENARFQYRFGTEK